MVDPANIGDNPHENRFVTFNVLPLVNSKVTRAPQMVDMSKGDPSKPKPIVNLVKNEIVQLRKLYNDSVYDFDVEKSTHTSITKNLTFSKEQRFGNDGIFGDLFDERKQSRFGSAFESLYDIDKSENAKMNIIRPRITPQKSFNQYVDRDTKSFEAETGSKCLTNILSLEDKRQRSVTSLKMYLDVRNEGLPSLDRISHLDYLPTRIQKRN